MNDNLKKAYIEDVVKHLPMNQRQDMRKEISALIDDLMEDDNKTIEDVLQDLGNPKLLALNYLDHDAYLIGPKYKTTYLQTLKFIIPLVWTIIIVFNLLTWLFAGNFSFDSMMSSAFNSTFIVFTYVTLGFMIAEYAHRDKPEETQWKLSDLDIEKHQTKVWPKSSSYIGIISLLVIIILFNRFEYLIGINVIGSNERVIFINTNQYHAFLPWINIALTISITRLFLRLFFPYYTKKSTTISISLNAIATIILMIVFLSTNFINPNLTTELQAMSFPEFINFDFIKHIFILISIIVFITFFIDTIQEIKYGFIKKK